MIRKTIAAKPPKQKKCRCGCGASFIPWSPLQTAASPECALKLAMKKRQKEAAEKAKAERKADRAKREKMKPRREWLKEAQVAFNAFIRERDRLAGHPCISSGKPLDWSGNNVDAGHYRSTGSAPHLRFDERNCHAQNKQDNRWLAGAAVDYRIGLVKRIGLAEVEALEADQTPRKWSIEELKRIRDTYRAKLKALKEAANCEREIDMRSNAEVSRPGERSSHGSA